VFLALAAACAGDGAPAGGIRGALRVGDVTRTFVLYAPPAARRSAAAPLLLAFHGTGESGAALRAGAGFDAVAAREGWVVVYPDAAVGTWAETCGCTAADRLGVNDTGFVRALIDSVAARFPVDRGRVFAAGFSQGGLFVHRLACDLADRVAAVASVAAPMSAALAPRCAPGRPVSVMVLQGTLDDAYPYEGVGRGQRAVLGARAAAGFWRALDRCPDSRLVTERPDTARDGTRVLEERWPGCDQATEVALVTVDGGRHTWSLSGDASTAETVAAFFLRAAPRRVVLPSRIQHRFQDLPGTGQQALLHGR
jgi:polyhydroxybutyrate depolymerase